MAPALPRWLEVLPLADPSATAAVVRGDGAVLLVDGGFGSEPAVAALEAALAERGIAPSDVRCVAHTHFHSDHVGPAAWLQRVHGASVVAHADDAALIADGDPRAHDRALLGTEVASYGVDLELADGDAVAVPGGPPLEVVHVPGQTPGHVAFWEPSDRVLLTGDLFQQGDVAWAHPDDLVRSIRALRAGVERLASLEPRVVVPGHGPPVVEDPAREAERAVATYDRWLEDPSLAGRHGAPRALAFWLMTEPPRAGEAVAALARAPWLRPLLSVSEEEAEPAARALLEEFDRRNLLARRDGRLTTTLPHTPPGPLRR